MSAHFNTFLASNNHNNTPTHATNPQARQPQARYRAVFISDLHLGTAGCQAEVLLDFLKVCSCQQLYLVGDIIDGWQLKRRWFWPESHNVVIQKLLRQARKGCQITFIPGNHDEFAREFLGHQFGGIEVAAEAVHTTAQGKRLWVIHGDQFDGVIQCARWLAYLGDNLYEFTLRLNRHLNHWRGRLGLPYWSLSAYLKFKVKKAMMYVNDFEEAVARGAARWSRRRGVRPHPPRRHARHQRCAVLQRWRLGGELLGTGRTPRWPTGGRALGGQHE